MADVTMNSATIPNVSPALGDFLLLWDISAAANGECTITDLNVLLATVFATIAGGNTFTGAQVINGDIAVQPYDNGAGLGRSVWIQNNTNVTTAAPGFIYLTQANGTHQRIWPDNTGILRIGAVSPTSANITAGTVVGTQTSNLASKDVEGWPAPIEEILAFVAAGAEAVRRFRYKAPLFPIEEVDENGNLVVVGVTEGERPMGGEEFSGLVVDFAPRYGMDRDEAHPMGKALNEINAIGDLMLAVDWLAGQVATLQAQIEEMQAGA